MKNIKKVLAVVLALVMVFGLAACGSGGNTTPANNDSGNTAPAEPKTVEEKIAAAEKMTEAELIEAAKKELEENKDLTFNADSLTSGVKKVAAAFEKKYEWAAGRIVYNSRKGSEYQPVLDAAAKADQYVADFVMIQDAAFLKFNMLDAGFLLSYTPSGDEFKFNAGTTDPQVGVTFNKIFLWNNTKVGKDQLQNVWQLTGVDGFSLKGLHNASVQSPLSEDINMNFFIMMTSPDAVNRLTAAYKSYFGKDYEADAAYKNIGYKFVADFTKNIAYWHKSDTSEVKELINYADDGRIVFAGLAKLKDYMGLESKPSVDDLTGAGWNADVEGFSGFVYNMWVLIPKTAKLPYTACLFIRYLLSEEGFQAGWGGQYGYYSANVNNKPIEGDQPLESWVKNCLVEDVDYIGSAYSDAQKFIKQQLGQ
ncbi:MAG: hypothetical protein J5535_07430 [Firmicutes bacterium]|nr:hypothetical protein [Bacillota bacterium]